MAKKENNIEAEAQKLIDEIIAVSKEKDSDTVFLEHDHIYKFIAEKDPNRVASILKSKMRINRIFCTQTPKGYQFTVQKKKNNNSKPEPAKRSTIEMLDNAEQAEVQTMTGFCTKYIAPPIFDDVKVLVSHGLQVLIVGPPGCGKSRLFEELAVLSNSHCVRRQMSQVYDPEQLAGCIQVVKDEKSGTPVTKFVPGSLTQSVQKGWFFIGDEYDNATPSCNESLKMITEDGGRMVIETEQGVEIISKHKNFRMGFTANTWGRGDDSGDFPNAHSQNSASLDRIDAFVEMKYDEKTERSIMKSLGIENHIIEIFYGKLKDGEPNPDPAKRGLIPAIRASLEENEVRGEIGIRKITSFCRQYNILGWHKAFLYGIMNKFDPEDHQFIADIITAQLNSELVPTNDTSSINSSNTQKVLNQHKLRGCN